MIVRGFDYDTMRGNPRLVFPEGNLILALINSQGLGVPINLWLTYLDTPGQTSIVQADMIFVFKGIVTSAVDISRESATLVCARQTQSVLVPITRCGPETNNFNAPAGTRIRWGTGEISIT